MPLHLYDVPHPTLATRIAGGENDGEGYQYIPPWDMTVTQIRGGIGIEASKGVFLNSWFDPCFGPSSRRIFFCAPRAPSIQFVCPQWPVPLFVCACWVCFFPACHKQRLFFFVSPKYHCGILKKYYTNLQNFFLEKRHVYTPTALSLLQA